MVYFIFPQEIGYVISFWNEHFGFDPITYYV